MHNSNSNTDLLHLNADDKNELYIKRIIYKASKNEGIKKNNEIIQQRAVFDATVVDVRESLK